MALAADNEILQDFLVEAGELLEALNDQLIQLEQSPEDTDLLNAVFRSFHTIKGGAGFLELEPLVEVCHRAEDVFNLCRNGERGVDSSLMDVMLRVLDVLNGQFEQLQGGEEPDSANPALLQELEGLMHAAPVEESIEKTVPAEPEQDNDLMAAIEAAKARDQEAAGQDASLGEDSPSEGPSPDEITDDEFERLLDDLHGKGKAPATAADCEKKDADHITDDEFDRLLDELHGEGKGPTAQTASAAPASGSGEKIGEDEFERLLDDLHGKGKGPSSSAPAEQPQKPAAANKGKPAGGGKQETSVRVDTQRLDAIMNLVGELVLVRNRMNTLKESFEDERVVQAVASLDTVTADLQAAVMKTRMLPVKKVFGRFPRVVRDVARNLKKEVNLLTEGEDTDLDKNLVEALADPLIHLVRNSVDHGIEMPDEREVKGKPRAGTVKLSAAQEGDHILLTIADDGAGMDAEKLRRLAVKKNLMDAEAASRLSDQEAYELIMAPGFSTKEEITDISGRGVGMDVVKNSINKLSGSIEIDSQKGAGTTIRIKLPLTLAILPTLMVVVGERKYAMPLANISEIFEFGGRKTHVVDGQLSVSVRQKALPLFFLSDWLSMPGDPESDNREGQVVLVQVGNQTVGLLVDQVIGQEEVVIKPLGDLLHGVPGMAGATITGDGHIALIIDVGSLLRHYARRAA